jgi:hypothetical protein
MIFVAGGNFVATEGDGHTEAGGLTEVDGHTEGD